MCHTQSSSIESHTVSLAGPATNIFIAIIGVILLKILFPGENIESILKSGLFYALFVWKIIYINLMLAIFNLLPIPPLDGSKIFSLILPEAMANAFLSLGRYGMFILFILLMFPIGGISIMGIVGNILSTALNLLGLL
jgi:Zn-dependent protease